MTNKLKEALDAINHDGAREILGEGRVGVSESALKVLINNARKHLKLCEAREKATAGEWVKDYDGTKGHIKTADGHLPNTPTLLRYDIQREYPDFSVSFEEQENNAHFICLAANLTRGDDDE